MQKNLILTNQNVFQKTDEWYTDYDPVKSKYFKNKPYIVDDDDIIDFFKIML